MKKEPNKKNNCKYIFVIGGVISGVGKGVASSSIGRILASRGRRVTSLKIDPYINIDAGTMNPIEHGEVFVLDDGDETDQDIGNYERFLNVNLSTSNYMTTGRVYRSVIDKERNLEYGGRCVEVVPHIPLEVIRRIEEARDKSNADVVIIEVGGTVGEYQNMLFLEAARMMKIRNSKDVFFVMVSYLPIPSRIGEMKTKPTQYAVRTLNSSGIQPDIIMARSKLPLDNPRKEKISMFCNIAKDHIISSPDVESIYDIPIYYEKQNLSKIISGTMGMKLSSRPNKDFEKWKKFAKRCHLVKKELKIAVVGKYFATGNFVLADSYISVIEAVKYSAISSGYKPNLTWISSSIFEGKDKKEKLKELSGYDGIIVPGGFGSRGIEGIINAIEYVREKKIPYFGLCYGMQLMVIEYARNILGLKDADTREINPKSKNLVIDVMEEQKEKIKNKNYGGTMRLGSYPAILKEGTIARRAYKTNKITERHRHRYEVNNLYKEVLEKAGLVFSATSPSGDLCEIAELPEKKHPFFLGTQFHPEFRARPLDPHPLFTAFIKACGKRRSK